MSRRQRIIVSALVLANALLLLGALCVVLLWRARLPGLASPRRLSTARSPKEPPVYPPTWTPTLTSTPRPTRPPGPTATPTETPLPIPEWVPTPTAPPQTSSRSSPGPHYAPLLQSGWQPASLDHFWAGQAHWLIETVDTGLPPEGSDTVHWGGEFWSYAHAGKATEGIKDQCGDPVPLPGCVTLWKSFDGGRHFSLERPVCLFPCLSCPCGERDHVQQQQYPRVAFDETGGTMVYEWGAGTFLRRSGDGVNWSGEAQVPGTGIWYDTQRPCTAAERIGPHPYVRPIYDCLAGAPPGLLIEGDRVYVFVGLGRAPGHMGCFVGDKHASIEEMQPCDANPLFGGASTYGPMGASGAAANPYFDFRTISSADVIRVGQRYYMAFEGTRGPDARYVRENQFALGFARSSGPRINGGWQTYPGNPVIEDVGDHWGLGHADLLVVDGVTYLYTTTSTGTRGRYVLVRK